MEVVHENRTPCGASDLFLSEWPSRAYRSRIERGKKFAVGSRLESFSRVSGGVMLPKIVLSHGRIEPPAPDSEPRMIPLRHMAG